MITKKYLISEYKIYQKSVTLIAFELGVNVVTVHRALNTHGIKRNKKAKDFFSKQTLKLLYLDQRLSINKVAELLESSAMFIRKSLAHHKIKQRSRKELCKIRDQRRFKNYTHRKISQGYVYIKMPGHHRANSEGHVREHIVVMESKIGRKLCPGEVVHHINGIKDDNRPENLQLFASQSEHITLHNKMRGDLFMLDRKDNTSCTATITKIIK